MQEKASNSRELSAAGIVFSNNESAWLLHVNRFAGWIHEVEQWHIAVFCFCNYGMDWAKQITHCASGQTNGPENRRLLNVTISG
ncbi:MAG: hypothetical protein PVF82_10545 [Gammaproteobacteria bacterium]|jgi:hypothetical protein